MNQFDLTQFAEYSQKLPAQFLAPVKTEKSQTWKILTAHFLDFGMGFLITTMMAAMFAHSMKMLMVTSGLRAAFSQDAIFGFSMSFLPFVMMGYFFFSYFMNHGQTWGMFLMKKRVDMKSQNFGEAFRWAAYSTLLCFSGGISFLAKKSIWQSYRSHDYLYHDLMAHKDSTSFSLLTMVQEFESQEVPPEVEWTRAA